MVELVSCFARTSQFRESDFDLLKEADIIANLDRFICSGAERECLGELGNDLDEALFSIVLLKGMFLCSRKQRHLFCGRSILPFRPIETMHHPTGDLVLLEHDCDCCGCVDARTAFAAALRVSRECVLKLIG